LENLEATEKVKAVLRAGRDDAYKSRELVVLRKDAPVKFSLEEMKYGIHDAETVNKFFVDYGFKSLLLHESTVDSRQTIAMKEINNLSEAKKVLGRVKDELSFYIVERKRVYLEKKLRKFIWRLAERWQKLFLARN